MLDLKEASQSQHPNHTPVRYYLFNSLEGSTRDGNHYGIPKSSKAQMLANVSKSVKPSLSSKALSGPWLSTILLWVLAPFENREISGVGNLLAYFGWFVPGLWNLRSEGLCCRAGWSQHQTCFGSNQFQNWKGPKVWLLHIKMRTLHCVDASKQPSRLLTTPSLCTPSNAQHYAPPYWLSHRRNYQITLANGLVITVS